MITYVSEQMYVFLATLYGGIIIGFIYDLYRIFRCIFKPKKLATIIEDLIFWIVISITAVSVLLFSNEGQLRFYTFLGFFAGVLLYNRILSNFIIKIIIVFLRALKKVLLKILKGVIYPIKLLINFLSGPWYWVKRKLSPVYYRFKRICLLPKILIKEMKKYIKLIQKKK
ncbi:spore cortex biosynthesis protein YabQ [Crassaminicella thermophila]|uniref:Spore cortex biosynthesis protein YabQ n=1 Tax=Crassaminicella thermophila TaxID=2599308 RepID=A0A5C0S8U6_CRATE|nr:spore cortex biosynthesis protein YabQ [Crassaminicella thermophila]QEK11085.1 spore cortex biosynthesis protein YabQ [Crassaminicella thermophila]